MYKGLGDKANRKSASKGLLCKDLEALEKINRKSEPVAYAYKVGTNEMQEFMTWEEAGKFFKSKSHSIYARACNNVENTVGRNIGHTWLICNADHKLKQISERWFGQVCV